MDNRHVLRRATDAYIAQLDYRIYKLGLERREVEDHAFEDDQDYGLDLDEIQEQIENTTRILDQFKAFRKTI